MHVPPVWATEMALKQYNPYLLLQSMHITLTCCVDQKDLDWPRKNLAQSLIDCNFGMQYGLLRHSLVVQKSMRDMKDYADLLLDNILNHPNLTEPQINQMPAFQKDDLRRRVKIADDVSCAKLDSQPSWTCLL